MKKAIVVDQNDIKKILAGHFGVPETDVIKSQYTYTVILEAAVGMLLLCLVCAIIYDAV